MCTGISSRISQAFSVLQWFSTPVTEAIPVTISNKKVGLMYAL